MSVLVKHNAVVITIVPVTLTVPVTMIVVALAFVVVRSIALRDRRVVVI